MSKSAYLVDPPRDAVAPRPAYDASTGSVAEDAVEAFQADGVVCLRNVLTMDIVHELRAGCEVAEAAASDMSYRVGGDGGPSFFYDINVSERVEAFRRQRDESRIPDLAQQLLGSETLGRYFDNLFIKDGGGGAATPWHEDASFQRAHGAETINFWISLDDIPRETTLQFLAGSHHRTGPVFLMGHFEEGEDYDGVITRDRVPMPPVEELTSAFDTVWWEMGPGDALVWYQRVLHASPGNTIDRPRRSIAYIWIGDDAFYNSAPGRVDPDLDDDTLSEGDHLSSAKFPQVRPVGAG